MRPFKEYVNLLLALVMATTLATVDVDHAEAMEALTIVALGDSYTSGNGAFDYYDSDCYRSANSYIHVFAELVSTTVEAHNYACHGAIAADISPQADAAREILAEADIVFFTIGGNDANFTGTIIDCLSLLSHITSCIDEILAFSENLSAILSGVDESIITIAEFAPTAEIVLVGYPWLVDQCGDDYEFVEQAQVIVDGLSRDLIESRNRVPFMSAGRLHYAGMLEAFVGRGVCSPDPLIHGSFSTDNFHEWWHPNVDGHLAIAEELVRVGIHNRVNKSDPPPTTSPPTTTIPGSHSYSNLPFSCGVEVPKATTYDTYNHNGTVYSHGHALDFPMPLGTKVRAPAGGTVYVKWNEGGYGRYIDIVATDGLTHRLAHMKYEVAISNGQYVSKGQTVGNIGVTGATTGPHLHYEQRRNGFQIEVRLDGPDLVWSTPAASGGDRYTKHSLISANCFSGKYAGSTFEEVQVHLQGGGHVRNIQGNGTTKNLIDGIMTPQFRIACDRNGNGKDELYSVEWRDKQWHVMMMTAPGGAYKWSAWRSNDFFGKTITGLSCGDRNGNGTEELKVHLQPGGEIWLLSPASETLLIRNKVTPFARVECDTDGDGRDEIYSLERVDNTTWRLMEANFNASGVYTSWRRFIPDSAMSGVTFSHMSCGDRNGNGIDEVKLFNSSSGRIQHVKRTPRVEDRERYVLWSGLTVPDFMIECDVDNDNIDEIYSVEDRKEGFFVMQGVYGPNGSMKRWSVYSTDFDSKSITALSCGNSEL